MALSSYPHLQLNKFDKNVRLRTAFTVGLFACTFLVTDKCFSQSSNPVVARIEREDIRQQDLDESLASQIYSLEQQLFALRMAALDNLITTKTLETEAAHQQLTINELKNRWMSGPTYVDPAQVNDLYYKNRQAFALMNPDEAKEKIRLDLESQIKLKRYREKLEASRQKLQFEVFLPQPRLHIAPSLSDSAAVKGPANAKVVITEFSDFQCPYCKEAQANLNKILIRYQQQVRLEFRHLPLEIHPLAQASARAAYCAGRQNSFWAFHDALFEATELSDDKIKDFAHLLHLNEDQFGSCSASDESQRAIDRDIQEARRLGIDGTPTFLVNGRLVKGANLDELEKAILAELGSSPIKTSTSPK